MALEKDSFSLTNISTQYNSNYHVCYSCHFTGDVALLQHMLYIRVTKGAASSQSRIQIKTQQFEGTRGKQMGKTCKLVVMHEVCSEYHGWHDFEADNGLYLRERENELVPSICSVQIRRSSLQADHNCITKNIISFLANFREGILKTFSWSSFFVFTVISCSAQNSKVLFLASSMLRITSHVTQLATIEVIFHDAE